jgi:23S rRNA pseudouridine1911/1915/1917 synthase
MQNESADMAHNTPNIVILFEDDDVIAINKPAGLVVHEDGRTVEPSVVDWIRATHPEVIGVGEPMTLQNGDTIDRPGIVHRLDRDTSGVLLIAKNQDAFLSLKQQFQKHEIEKRYHAFVYGSFKELAGTIDKAIGRSTGDFRKWSSGKGTRLHTRPAITRYTVLLQNKEAAYLDLSPKTGRTHQIRVHLQTIGHPVVCDSRYAPNKPPILGFKRLALHAASLTCTLPSGQKATFEAPEPPDFVYAKSLLV